MSELVDRVERARLAWNSGDLDGYLTLYDSSITLHGYGPEPFDKATVSEFYRDVWLSLHADGKPNPDLEFFELLVDGRLLAGRYRMSGRHHGPFMGVPPTGLPYALNGITILRFGTADTVVERFNSADMLSLLVQLGAVPAPVG